MTLICKLFAKMAKQAFFNSLQIKAKGAGLPESPSRLCAFFYFQKTAPRMVKEKGLEHHAYKPFSFAIKQQQLFLPNIAARVRRRDTPIKPIG